LGKGFSGDVIGKEQLKVLFPILNSQTNSSFPDSNSIRHLTIVPDRVGSVGGEI
jgi:hypothetical protein